MIPNQAQPATTGGQTQTPTLPPPSESNLFNADPAALDFGFDEATGQFRMQFKEQAKETIQPDTSTKVNDTTQQDSQQQSPNLYEDRFGRIEAAMINLAGMLEGMRTNAPATQTQQQEAQTPELDINSGDFAANLVNIINSAIDKKFGSFEEKLKPMEKNVSDINDRVLLTDLAMKYPDFVEYLPAMTEYKRSDPKASWESLYNAMKIIPRAKKDSTTQTTNGSNNGQPQVDLAQRAQQLATVRDSVSASVVTEPRNTKLSVQQAVEKSINELFGN